MKGYGQFCPIAVACEIFAERWTPLILRELFAGSRRFNEIRSGHAADLAHAARPAAARAGGGGRHREPAVGAWPGLSAFSVSNPKNRSTRFSHDAYVGVK